jgi:FkbM family methyltransferase
MGNSEATLGQLPLRTKLLAALMRRMPVGIRRVEWWWMQMYRGIGGGGFDDDEAIDSRWPAGDQRPVRTRRHGLRLFLNLQAWPERRTYFSGTYYQQELEMLFEALLRPADQFLDIGANIGMISLLASPLIGGRGAGFSFEPNPEVFAKLRRHFEVNKITNLEAMPFALGDRESVARLAIPRRNSGCGSLAGGAADEGAARVFEVETVAGRRYLERLDSARPTVVKIDVEGYEVKVLRGIEEILDWPEVAFVIEVKESLLRKAGDSAETVFDLFVGRGYRPYRFSLRRGRLARTLSISRVERVGLEEGSDVLFVKPDSRLHRERIVPLLSGAEETPRGTTCGH